LKKINPSMTSVAAFRKAAYGDESLETTDLGVGRMLVQEVTTNTEGSLTSTRPLTTETELVMKGDGRKLKAQAGQCDEAEIVTSDDAEMSIGDLDEEETGSDGFSGSDASSSGGESVVSRGSRKRLADESPDRQPADMIHKEFPGTVTRSHAGCRIYVPPPAKKEEEGTRCQICSNDGRRGRWNDWKGGVRMTGVEGVGTTGVEGVMTTTELNMEASTLFPESIRKRDATATTIMTVVGVGTTIHTVPSTSVLTTEGTSTEARCETAALTTASQAAVLLIETGAVIDLAAAENTDMTNVTGTFETTVPAMDLKSMTGPQAATAQNLKTCQSTASAQGPRPEQVVVASGLETVATVMPANTQATLF